MRGETEPHSNSEVLTPSLVLGVDVIPDRLGQPQGGAGNHRRDGTSLISTKMEVGFSLGTNNVVFSMTLSNYRD